MQDASVPQAWFWHFYALGTAANAGLLALHVCYMVNVIVRERRLTRFMDEALPEDNLFAGFCAAATSAAVLAMFQLHLVRRLVESVFIMRCAPCRHAGGAQPRTL
jgi:hypothetical protein